MTLIETKIVCSTWYLFLQSFFTVNWQEPFWHSYNFVSVESLSSKREAACSHLSDLPGLFSPQEWHFWKGMTLTLCCECVGWLLKAKRWYRRFLFCDTASSAEHVGWCWSPLPETSHKPHENRKYTSLDTMKVGLNRYNVKGKVLQYR